MAGGYDQQPMDIRVVNCGRCNVISGWVRWWLSLCLWKFWEWWCDSCLKL